MNVYFHNNVKFALITREKEHKISFNVEYFFGNRQQRIHFILNIFFYFVGKKAMQEVKKN
jgi:hypothetical protein